MATVGHVGIVMYTRVWTTCEEQHLLVLIVLQTDAAVCIKNYASFNSHTP